MVKEGLRNVAAGAAPVRPQARHGQGRRGRQRPLLANAREVEGTDEIGQVASLSAQDTVIGETIAEAFDKVGKDGVITVEESSTTATELEFTEGMQFDKGYISAYFVTDAERMEAVLEDAYILINQGKISSIPTCSRCSRRSSSPASRWSSSPRTSTARRSRRSSSTRSAAPSRSPRSRPPASATAARRCCRTWRSSPAARSSPRRSASSSTRPASTCSARPAASSSPRTPRRSSTAGRQGRRRRRVAPDQGRDRAHRLRLGPREAAGAPGQAGRRRLRHQGRRPHRGRAQGEEAPHRGRHLGDPRGDRGGHRRRRRHRPHPRGHGHRRAPLRVTRPRVRRSSSKAAAEPLRWIAENAGLQGYVVTTKVAELPIGQGLNAATGRVRGPRQGRRHRPGQGDPVGAAQRRVDRLDDPHHRHPRRGEEGRGARSRAGHGHGHGH
jgi:hypothetical protein